MHIRIPQIILSLLHESLIARNAHDRGPRFDTLSATTHLKICIYIYICTLFLSFRSVFSPPRQFCQFEIWKLPSKNSNDCLGSPAIHKLRVNVSITPKRKRIRNAYFHRHFDYIFTRICPLDSSTSNKRLVLYCILSTWNLSADLQSADTVPRSRHIFQIAIAHVTPHTHMYTSPIRLIFFFRVFANLRCCRFGISPGEMDVTPRVLL